MKSTFSHADSHGAAGVAIARTAVALRISATG